MISGLVLKYLNRECFIIRRGYETARPVSSSFCLTVPTKTSPLGNKLVYPKGEAKVVSAKFTIAVGEEAARHTHPAPFYAHKLQGSLTAIYDDGTM